MHRLEIILRHCHCPPPPPAPLLWACLACYHLAPAHQTLFALSPRLSAQQDLFVGLNFWWQESDLLDLSIWRGLRCCGEPCPICQQNSDASWDALNLFPDSLNWPLMHKHKLSKKNVWHCESRSVCPGKLILKKTHLKMASSRRDKSASPHFGRTWRQTVDTRSRLLSFYIGSYTSVRIWH